MKKEQFLPMPHCPSQHVTLCAVGACYTDVQHALERLGINVFEIPENPKLSIPVRFHPDLQLGMLKGESIAVGKGETSLKKRLKTLGFTVMEMEKELYSSYPQEALLDFAIMDNHIIGNTNIVKMDNLLNNSQIIHVNQGYTKCNLAPINEHALITSDSSISIACRKAGFDVLQIQSGYIELPGYSTGFIGGCCGLIAKDQLAICGELKTHPDCASIKYFLNQHHVNIIELCAGTLKDIGGIIPLKQIHESFA